MRCGDTGLGAEIAATSRKKALQRHPQQRDSQSLGLSCCALGASVVSCVREVSCLSSCGYGNLGRANTRNLRGAAHICRWAA